MIVRGPLVGAVLFLTFIWTSEVRGAEAGWATTGPTRSGDVSVRDYGAAGDGKSKDTPAIQRAIDAAAAAGGGTVVLPAGVYLSGTIFLRDHVVLHLAPGAILLGSTDLKDYPIVWPKFKSQTDTYVCQALIYGEDLHDIGITGRGTIDGQGGDEAFDWHKRTADRPYGYRPFLVRLVTCRQVLVQGISLRNSPMWTQHYLACDDVTIDGLTVSGHCNANNDMIDLDCCRNVRMSNCTSDTLDDGITLKSCADRACENITVTNCVVSSWCNAIKCGTESNGGFRNIAISNCVVRPSAVRSDKGEPRPGTSGISLLTVDGGVLENVSISNIVIEGPVTPIFLRLGDRARPFKPDGPRSGVGIFRDVSISHVTASAAGRIACGIAGLPGHPIENVTLDDIRITFAGGGTIKDSQSPVPELKEKYPQSDMFGTLPAYGFFVRHAAGLTLRNIELHTAKPDQRPAMICEDVRDLTVDGWQATAAPGGLPVIVLQDVVTATLRGCRAMPGTSVFLRVAGTSDRIALLGNDLGNAVRAYECADPSRASAVFENGNRPPRSGPQ